MAGSGCTDRSSEARALASEMAATAWSQSGSACPPPLSAATAARARSSSSLEARANSSGFPAKSAAASGGKQFLPHAPVGLQRGLERDPIARLQRGRARRVEDRHPVLLHQMDD